MKDIDTIINEFFPNSTLVHFNKLSSGLINDTYKITVKKNNSKLKDYILQGINNAIFQNPHVLINNHLALQNHLNSKKLDLIVPLIPNPGGAYSFVISDKTWRVFPFVAAYFSIEKIENKKQAYSGAKMFGEFMLAFADFDISLIEDPLPDFTNYEKRLKAFKNSLEIGSKTRIDFAFEDIRFLLEKQSIINEALLIIKNLPKRVTHNDTKISNLLFDTKNDEAKKVIDLDTVMIGTVMNDFGDMVRTFCPTLPEHIKDATDNKIDLEIFEEMCKGFSFALKKTLTRDEKNALYNGATLYVYVQALRFLTDFINEDVYYQIEYETQNYYRSLNQIYLLKSILANEDKMKGIIVDCFF